MQTKIYDVTVTSRKGRVWRYQVEATSKCGARYKAGQVKRHNYYKGRTVVVDSLIPYLDKDIVDSIKSVSSDSLSNDRFIKINSVKID